MGLEFLHNAMRQAAQLEANASGHAITLWAISFAIEVPQAPSNIGHAFYIQPSDAPAPVVGGVLRSVSQIFKPQR